MSKFNYLLSGSLAESMASQDCHKQWYLAIEKSAKEYGLSYLVRVLSELASSTWGCSINDAKSHAERLLIVGAAAEHVSSCQPIDWVKKSVREPARDDSDFSERILCYSGEFPDDKSLTFRIVDFEFFKTAKSTTHWAYLSKPDIN